MSSAARADVVATGVQDDRTRRRRRRARSRGVTALMYAAQQGDVDRVRKFIRAQSSSLFERDRTGKSALHYCCTSDSLCAAHAADLLVMAAPDLVEGRDEDGFTPLHLAVIAGNMQLVTFLLANNADINAVDNEKHTVVHWATVCGETAALRAVLAAGAPVSTPDVHGGYPLHYAAQMCGGTSNDKDSSLGMQVLQSLLTHKDIVVSVMDGDKRQPLLWAASAGSSKAVLALVRAGAAVEAADKDGLTALHCAASRGHTDCLDTLLTLCGASPDVIDSNGCTALHYAVTLGHADATALLLAHGADPNRQDRKGRSPAHCGCAKGQFETVKLIGAHRAKLWLKNARGDLPLHEAAASGRRELVKWLLDMRPSQVNARNNDGRCPLHMAALNDNADMCKILLDAGAQVNPVLRTSRNVFMTPLDCALQRGFRSTAKYLQLHGGVPASRLAELRNQPTSALNLHIRDDVTVLGDTSSESEKEQGDPIKSSKKSYRKKIVHKLERPKLSLSGSEEEIERLGSSKLESTGKSKKRSTDRNKEKKSSAKADSSTPPMSSTKRSSSRKLPSSRMEYTNEIIINGKTEINIHQTREIILEKEPVVVDKISEVVIPSETTVPQSASSVKDRRPRSAKFSKGRDRSGRASAEKEAARARNAITSPTTIIQKEKESRQPSLKTQSTNTSEETTETVIENKKIEPTTATTEDGFLKNFPDSKKIIDQQSLMSNTSEDVEDHKEFVVEASIHEPPKVLLEKEHEDEQELKAKDSEIITEGKQNEKPLTGENIQNDDLAEEQEQQKATKVDDTNAKLTTNDTEKTDDKEVEDQKTKETSTVLAKEEITDDNKHIQHQLTESPRANTSENIINEAEAEMDNASDTKKDDDKTEVKDATELQTNGEAITTKEIENTEVQEPVHEKQSVEELQETRRNNTETEEANNELDKDNSKVAVDLEANEKNDQLLDKFISEPEADQAEHKASRSTDESSNLPEDGESKDAEEIHENTDTPEKTHEDAGATKDVHQNVTTVNEQGEKTLEVEDGEEKKVEITSKSIDVNENDIYDISKTEMPSKIDFDEQPLETVPTEKFEQSIADKEKPSEGEITKKRDSKQKETRKKQGIEASDGKTKPKDADVRKKHLKIEKPNKKIKAKQDYSDDDYSSRSEDVSLSTPTSKTHKSFRILDEEDGGKPGKAKGGKSKRSENKESRSRSEEKKKKDGSKEREKIKHSKIPTPLGKTILSKSDRHLDKSHLLEKRALQGVLDARIPSLPNIHQDKDRLKEPPRSESNMSAPLLASLYSDNESLSDVEHESRSLVARNKKRVKKRPKVRDARSAGSDYESSNLIDSGFEPSPRSTRIPKWKNMSERGVNMTSVTQNIQSNIRRYHLERKIFQHLLELKRHQIRAGQHNEAVLVKRAIDAYHQSCASTVGAGRYIPEDYTFKSFERFLYESLRKLQKNDVEYMKGLPEAPSNPLLCTRSTNRCMHATHAYTGVPCAAYLPKMDHHTIPKIGFNNVSCKPGTGFLPNINSKKAVTLELSHGTDKQVISLPTDRLDQNKRYYVTFTVKGHDPSSSNGEDGPTNNAHMHSKSD